MIIACISVPKPFPKQRISKSSKLKEFADDMFKFDENSEKLSKRVENSVGNGEITFCEQFLLSLQFSKELFCRHIKPGAYLGKG